MKVFRATSGEWQSGQTHYLVAAENADQAYELLNQWDPHLNVDYDSVSQVDCVSANVSEPVVLDEF